MFSPCMVCSRGGKGTKIQIQVRFLVSNKLRIESGTGPRKNVTENTCITGEVIRRHKSFQYVSTTISNLPRPEKFFSLFSIWRDSKQSILSLRLASATADLIPYPFGSGIEEKIPVLPGQIQIPVPSLACRTPLSHIGVNTCTHHSIPVMVTELEV